MKPWFYFAAFLIVASCSSTPADTNEGPDSFMLAAESWKGGLLSEMQSVWGNPAVVLSEPSPGSDGAVVWKFSRKSGGLGTTLNATRGGSPSQNIYCSVTVKHDTIGVITDVDVISSKKCLERYEGSLDYLSRPQ
jgi:hypothetical protein